jgi:MarR family transcriptional regulator, negative regulator of the multidrug operon emrRAB
MNNPDPDSPFDKLEANLRALSERVPDLPFSGILLCRLVLHLGREMAAGFEQRLRPFGLVEAEFRVLTTLFSQPDGVAHPSDLCARTDQSPANMSRISDALVSRDLITRVLSVQDRRRIVLRITEQGEDLVRQLLPKLFVSLRGMLAEFSESEQRLLIAQLKRLHANLQEAHKQTLPEQAE